MNAVTSPLLAGKVWKFGDDMNTDLMLPGHIRHGSEAEQARYVFSANRPGWVEIVQRGDFLVAGRNFGMGSSRPAARSLRNVGLACVLAETINGLFFRNAVNYGMLSLECPGVSTAFEEGDVAELELSRFLVRNRRTGAELPTSPVPPNLLELMQGGGLFPLLEKRGLISPE